MSATAEKQCDGEVQTLGKCSQPINRKWTKKSPDRKACPALNHCGLSCPLLFSSLEALVARPWLSFLVLAAANSQITAPLPGEHLPPPAIEKLVWCYQTAELLIVVVACQTVCACREVWCLVLEKALCPLPVPFQRWWTPSCSHLLPRESIVVLPALWCKAHVPFWLDSWESEGHCALISFFRNDCTEFSPVQTILEEPGTSWQKDTSWANKNSRRFYMHVANCVPKGAGQGGRGSSHWQRNAGLSHSLIVPALPACCLQCLGEFSVFLSLPFLHRNRYSLCTQCQVCFIVKQARTGSDWAWECSWLELWISYMTSNYNNPRY